MSYGDRIEKIFDELYKIVDGREDGFRRSKIRPLLSELSAEIDQNSMDRNALITRLQLGEQALARAAHELRVVSQSLEDVGDVCGLGRPEPRKCSPHEEELIEKLQYALDYVPTDEGKFTFPDGDTWDASAAYALDSQHRELRKKLEAQAAARMVAKMTRRQKAAADPLDIKSMTKLPNGKRHCVHCRAEEGSAHAAAPCPDQMPHRFEYDEA